MQGWKRSASLIFSLTEIIQIQLKTLFFIFRFRLARKALNENLGAFLPLFVFRDPQLIYENNPFIIRLYETGKKGILYLT